MSVYCKDLEWWFWETLLVEEELKRKERGNEYAV